MVASILLNITMKYQYNLANMIHHDIPLDNQNIQQSLGHIIETHNIQSSTPPTTAFSIIHQIQDKQEQYTVLSAYIQLQAFQDKLVCSGSPRYWILYHSDLKSISEVWKNKTDQDILRFSNPQNYAEDVLHLQDSILLEKKE